MGWVKPEDLPDVYILHRTRGGSKGVLVGFKTETLRRYFYTAEGFFTPSRNSLSGAFRKSVEDRGKCDEISQLSRSG